MAAALTLPVSPLGASDFDDFRVPDHRSRSIAASLATSASQTTRNSFLGEESGSWDSGLTGNGNWFRDSERLQTSTSFNLGAQGLRNREETHWLNIGPSVVQRSDQIESHRALHEFWTIGLAARVYPWSLPISIGTGVTNLAAYDQDWMDRHGVDRVQVSQPPPFDRRSVTQGDVNEWRYSYDTIVGGDVGLGRVRDATGVYQAQLLLDRLGRDGVLARPPSKEARVRLARLYYIESDYSVAHDRSAKFFWRDVEKILSDDGALGPAGLDAYSLHHALEPYFIRSFSRGNSRRTGWFAGVQFSGFYRNQIVRSTDHLFQAAYNADTLVYATDQTRSDHIALSIRSPLAGLELEYHRPLDLRWQLDANAQARTDVRGLSRLTDVQSRVEVGYLLADRWSARGVANQSRTVGGARDQVFPADQWDVDFGAELSYYLEDRVKLTLTASEAQQSVRGALGPFGSGIHVYERRRSVFLGLSYSILRGYDAPGLVDRGRPLH
ncbi:MAG: hypothetical protein E6K73_09635 [Candidatus Eisenbacteria bacterium]|uniref:Uncharacterized protein n=1 Tax=Eiseniibacteriota bacterium TaxID=2212470 RepID=A0A538SE38_UNCEI|nr:MAG: hypothetical protein E6K73_09635 [Candidatus Eisenbacteria bacterium]